MTANVSTLSADQPGDARRSLLLLSVAVAAGMCLCGFLWASNRALAAQVEVRQARTTQLAADAAQIARIRQRPQQARETHLRANDLLQQVHAAMQAGGVDAAALASTVPQPPRKTPGTPHAEISQRLLFEKITLEQLVRFAAALTDRSPQLRVSGVQLQAAANAQTWNADVTVAYWVVAP